MKFEHLVQINDPLIPLLTQLTREQLWNGMMRRAEHPAEFVLGLNGSVTHQRVERDGVLELARTLDFGSFKVNDRVRLTPLESSETRVEATASFAASSLLIRIEEPSPDQLFLRFIYQSDDDGNAEIDDVAQALRKQAYESADLDTVQRIRQLAEEGRLG